MTGKSWAKRPLWEELKSFTDEIDTDSGNNLALRHYKKVEAILRNSTHRVEFQATLSLTQYNSFRVIEEWFNCCIEEDAWFRTNLDQDKALAVLDCYPIVDQASPMVIQILLGTGPITPRISTYRLQVWRLFQMEFDPSESPDQDPIIFRGFLQAQRERAAFHAAVQRLCFPYFPNVEVRSDAGIRGKGKQSKGSNVEVPMHNVIGASIEACPWLDFKPHKDSFPFYLWNVQERRTVITETLDYVPEYVCISHTWGRWNNPSDPFALIENVPWLVPQNSRFRVQDLPEILARKFPVQYIWLDLFCIPQDRSELALLEISRQAQIFGTAKTVVTWLFEVDDWTGLSNIIEWLALYCIMNRGGVDEILPIVPANNRTSMVLESQIADEESLYTPIGWFTSLWTLQEACLRPDMLLCNRDFEILVSPLQSPVTLDSISALFDFTIGHYPRTTFETLLNRDGIPRDLETGTVAEFEQINPPGSIRCRRALEKMPTDIPGLQEIYDLLLISGLNSLYRMSQVSILYLGQSRQCRGGRAEAIMSAVGATNQYKKHVLDHHTPLWEDELVLGLYPSPFLNEAAQNIGAVFYATVASKIHDLDNVVDVSDGVWRPLESSMTIGSLLPFTKSSSTLVLQDQNSQSWYGHPSVASWTIGADGKVFLPEAGVIASSASGDEGGKLGIMASVMIPEIFTTTSERQIDLVEWLRTFWNADSAPNYAISLFQQTSKVQFGLVLKTVKASGVLVKIGTFLTASVKVEHVVTKKVNWVVL